MVKWPKNLLLEEPPLTREARGYFNPFFLPKQGVLMTSGQATSKIK